MISGRLIVVKVGGSLLDMPDFAERLSTYLRHYSNDRLLLLIGGGGAADWVRLMDRTHRLGEETSHDLALRSLELTAHLVAALLPESVVIDDVSLCPDVWSSCRVPILSPRLFLHSDDLLPRNWGVTSDSIAARTATWLGADELVLLKSVEVPPGELPEEMAARGVVDPYFPTAARSLRLVSVACLRTTFSVKMSPSG
jgi:aspartokinase-like uncharacterized kinase